MNEDNDMDRRAFLLLASIGGAGLTIVPAAFGQKPSTSFPKTAEAFPLEAVRLKPSPFLDAVNANLKYLHKIEPDRLLHNFRKHAGLEPRAKIYGGWRATRSPGRRWGIT